jgi:hypothetical protein
MFTTQFCVYTVLVAGETSNDDGEQEKLLMSTEKEQNVKTVQGLVQMARQAGLGIARKATEFVKKYGKPMVVGGLMAV